MIGKHHNFVVTSVFGKSGQICMSLKKMNLRPFSKFWQHNSFIFNTRKKLDPIFINTK